MAQGQPESPRIAGSPVIAPSPMAGLRLRELLRHRLVCPAGSRAGEKTPGIYTQPGGPQSAIPSMVSSCPGECGGTREPLAPDCRGSWKTEILLSDFRPPGSA